MYFYLPVLSLLVAQTAPSPSPQTTFPAEFYVGGSGTYFSQGATYHGWRGGGSASATWFLVKPLVDDDAPLAIQAFLQRVSRLTLSFGGETLSGSDLVNSREYDASSVHVSPSGFFYLGDLILGAGFYYTRNSSLEQHVGMGTDGRHTTEVQYPWLTFGLRWEDLELLGTYDRKSYYDDGILRPREWGQAAFHLRSVLEKELYWDVGAYTLVDGGGVNFRGEEFVTPLLGAWVHGYWEKGQVYFNSRNDYSRLGIDFGVGWWATRRLEFQFSIGFSSATRAGGNYTPTSESFGAFGIVLRAPERSRLEPAPASTPQPASALLGL